MYKTASYRSLSAQKLKLNVYIDAPKEECRNHFTHFFFKHSMNLIINYKS